MANVNFGTRPAAAGRPFGARARALAAAALCCVTAAGCGVSNLAFVQDSRVHFVAPKPRALVALPLTIRWAAAGPVGSDSYAVFVDRSPVKPGQSLAVVADRSCRRTPGCVNAGYLADRGVYATSGTELTIRQINSTGTGTVQTHEATVVLMDSAGRRVGESAWYVDFRMRKAGA